MSQAISSTTWFTAPESLERYREQVLYETQYVNFAGIPLPTNRVGRVLTPLILLDKVYIKLRAIDERQQREHERQEQKEVAKKFSQSLNKVIELGEYLYYRGSGLGDRDLTTIDPMEALRKNNKIVILGAPGSGKSTLLRWMARQTFIKSNERIPIRIMLREYATAHQMEPTLSLREFGVQQAARGDDGLQKALEEAIQANNALWLIDALDETRVSAENIAREAINLPGQVVITSRQTGFTGAGLENYPVFEIQPLSTKHVESFINNWFIALKNSFPDPAEINTHWIEERKSWLKMQLEHRPQIACLTHTPLLLTFLVMLAGSEPLLPIPESRAELFTSFIARLYSSWEKRTTPDEVRRMAVNGFAYLGWGLHFLYFAGKPDIEPTREVLIKRLSQYEAKEWSRPSEKQVEDVLDFWQRAGMVESWPMGQSEYLIFRHQMFQEFAAGMVLKDCWETNPKKTWQFLRPRLHIPAWREPILFMASMVSDQQKIRLVKEILKAGSRWEKELQRDLRLAIRIVGEQTQPSSLLTDLLSKPLYDICKTHQKEEEFSRHWVKEQVIDAVLPPSSKWKKVLLRQFLNDRNIFVVEAAVRALGKLGDWDGVLEVIHHQDSYVRIEVIRTLRNLNDPEKVLPIAWKAIRDPEADVRSEAFQIIKKFDDRETLRVSLKSELTENRWLAINCLTSLKDRDSLPSIREMYKDPSAEVRNACAWALGELEDQTSIHELRQLLGDEDENVCMEAAGSLVTLGDLDTLRAAMKDKRDYTRTAVASVLAYLDDQELIEGAVKDPCVEVRKATADSLLQIKRNDLLRAMLKDEDEDVRWLAMGNLFALKDPEYFKLLHSGLRDENINRRTGSAYLLNFLNDPESIPVLRQALYQEDKESGFSAAVSLGELGYQEALPKLVLAVFTCNDLNTTKSAIRALGMLGNIEGLPALNHAAKSHDYDIQYEAKEAVKQLAVKAKTAEIAKRIAKEIRTFDSPEALNILAERLDVLELQSKSEKDLLLAPKTNISWRKIIQGIQLGLIGVLAKLGYDLIGEIIKGNQGPVWLIIIVIFLLVALSLWEQWLKPAGKMD